MNAPKSPTGFVPDIASRRPLDSGSQKRPGDRAAREESPKQMIIGRDIVLAGDIESCERLIVEGSFNGKLHKCRAIEIAATGVLKGDADVQDAEVSGRFEGDLTVRRSLVIHQTGRIYGKIRYKTLEVSAGGRLGGDIGSLDDEEPPADVPADQEDTPAAEDQSE
ncbi:MAG: polymer-forming cytoskeletal protein [Alphaproteobacteria bacterium]|nr:polymer-forming cytoskeletal protein [Alphaproteobacteria bacterium]